MIPLVIFIIKTAACVLFAVLGICLLSVPKENWEQVLERAVSLPNLEVTQTTMVCLRILGATLLLLGFIGVFMFLI